VILFGLGALMGFWCGVAAAVTWEAYLDKLYNPDAMTREERERLHAVREEYMRGRR